MSARTARIVLAQGTLRWSSPSLFNDPFDVPRELAFGVESKDIAEAVVRKLVSLIEQPPTELSNLTPKVRLILDVARLAPREVREETIAEIRKTYQGHPPTGESLNDLRALWREWIPTFRILCLTESPAHAAMWLHYADRYSGAVVELACSDERDSAWLEARPVRYLDGVSETFRPDGWARILMMPQRQAAEALLDEATYTKSADWSYEKEWRVTSWMGPADTGLSSDLKFHPADVSAVYIGPMMVPEDKEALTAAANALPLARVVEVRIGMGGAFSLVEARS